MFPPKESIHDYLGFSPLYDNSVAALGKLASPGLETGRASRWTEHFRSYDRLRSSHVFVELGGWIS